MAEAATEVPDAIAETKQENPATQDMEVETVNTSEKEQVDGADSGGGETNSKRAREEGTESEKEEDGGSKKQRGEKSVEEQRLENLGGSEEGGGGDESGRVNVGPKDFGSSTEIFDYFYKLLHYWPPNLNVNKYEHMMLLDLLKKGHQEPDKKIRDGVHAFQVRYHPQFKSRCFFIIRNDETVDDFSFRKCVDHILPLPENLQLKPGANKSSGGGGHGGKGGGGRGGGRGRGHGRGRGRGGK